MKIIRHFRNHGMSVLALEAIRDYLNQEHSQSLGSSWGHKTTDYELFYRTDNAIRCNGFPEARKAVDAHGDTRRFRVHFESKTGRLLKIDATQSDRITIEADNRGNSTSAFVARVEELLGLQPLPSRVFVAHGRSDLWLRVARFIEKESGLHLDTLELAEESNKGRTVIGKLLEEGDKCSYAVIVMTGDDFVDDEIRARENVIHELGYFQGRYGSDRVCILHEDGVKLPSNLGGVVYHAFPKGDITGVFAKLQQELRTAFEPPATD